MGEFNQSNTAHFSTVLRDTALIKSMTHFTLKCVSKLLNYLARSPPHNRLFVPTCLGRSVLFLTTQPFHLITQPRVFITRGVSWSPACPVYFVHVQPRPADALNPRRCVIWRASAKKKKKKRKKEKKIGENERLTAGSLRSYRLFFSKPQTTDTPMLNLLVKDFG